MIPTATYRLQLRSEFGFRDAAAIVPYLASLGISHIYCSPILQATPGSAHGYDVVDHSRLSEDLGGDEGWAELVDACGQQGLGIVVDVVPNHMALPNPKFDDVERRGRESEFAHWFDIDWDESERSGQLIYRRFFDVSSLIGVRVEDPDVFAATHERLLDLVRRLDIDGLRIDHPDGLADPRGYLDRLAAETGRVWTVVEKVLEPGEHLPHDWACAGTTGYDAIRAITHVLLDPSARDAMTEIYHEKSGETATYEDIVDDAKRHVVTHVLVPEVDRLERELGDRAAIIERLVATQVYRTYTGDPRNVRFEQTTGPVMAKGVEDTAFYRYFRLTALNEVGGDPGAFGMRVDDWHVHCAQMQRDWPHTMTTLTTHDTKRSEDVRARLLVLAEIPAEWSAAVERWRATAAASYPLLDRNTDYLFWQTMVGAWPLSFERMQAYLHKATHEAKRQTSWLAPDDEYDSSVQQFAANVFGDAALMAEVETWTREHVDEPGLANALAQKMLQLTMPGVPDVYQGQELSERSLVDPDNRRPVDYQCRIDELGKVAPGADIDPKMFVTACTLRLRGQLPEEFAASYEPVRAHGSTADHVIAYRRGSRFLTVVTRLPVGLARRGGWADTELDLPDGEWSDVFSAQTVTKRLADWLGPWPVALLVRQPG